MSLLTPEEERVLLMADDIPAGGANFQQDIAEAVAGLFRLGFLKRVYMNDTPVVAISESGHEAAKRIRERRALS